MSYRLGHLVHKCDKAVAVTTTKASISNASGRHNGQQADPATAKGRARTHTQSQKYTPTHTYMQTHTHTAHSSHTHTNPQATTSFFLSTHFAPSACVSVCVCLCVCEAAFSVLVRVSAASSASQPGLRPSPDVGRACRKCFPFQLANYVGVGKEDDGKINEKLRRDAVASGSNTEREREGGVGGWSVWQQWGTFL